MTDPNRERSPRRGLCRASSLALQLIALGGLFVWALVAQAQDGEVIQERVFKLERSKNSKVVQYDIRLGADRRPIAGDPIAGYWLRQDGSTSPLKRFQWTVYGFDATCSEACEVVTIEMKANIGRLIRIYEVDGVYRAETEIAGARALIERIYIKSTERRFLWPRVDWIDFEGTDVATGERRSERYIP
jgi:hypothetical protein